jgi:HD-like signal output (HDOD) protein/ActR/RegA family two-component response regulator
MRHILFVDDDPNVLDGLRDALRSRRREWRMSFVNGGEEAVAVLEREPVDIVVSDLRMPGMDGATLLTKVAQIRPDAVRIVLSGQADPDTIGRVAAVAHRILVKPSPIEDVTRVIERSCVLLDVTGEVQLIRAAAGACALPSAPRTYPRLLEVLGHSDASAAQVTAVVERDIALSAKVLQLANSPYVGSAQPVSSLDEAVALLGHETVRALALSVEAFQKFDAPTTVTGFSFEAVQRRSLQVAQLARLLSEDHPEADDAFAAGLLLDIGLLVLACNQPDHLGEVLAAAADEGRPVHELELERTGITHAEIGAHLLALWGLPHAIVEAVAHHHRPLRSPSPGFDTVAIAHIADALASGTDTGDALGRSRIDEAYIERIGVAHRLAAWRQLAADALLSTPV